MKQFYAILIATLAMVTFQSTSLQAGALFNGNKVSALTFNDSTSGHPGSDTDPRIGKDGKSAFSNREKASSTSANADFQVNNNAEGANFIASFDAPKTGMANVCIKNAIGQTVHSETIVIIKGHNAAAINTTDLKVGIYYVQINNDEVNFNGKLQKLQE